MSKANSKVADFTARLRPDTKSIFFQITTIIFATGLVLATALASMYYVQLVQKKAAATTDLQAEMATMFTETIAQDVRRGVTRRIEIALEGLEDRSGNRFAFAEIRDTDGAIVATHGASVALPSAEIASAIAAAQNTGAPQIIAEHQLVVVPVYLPNGALAGSMQLVWDLSATRAAAQREALVTGAILMGIILFWALGLRAILRRTVGRPLRGIGDALARLEARNYAVDPALLGRSSEMVAVTQRLSSLGETLAQAEANEEGKESARQQQAATITRLAKGLEALAARDLTLQITDKIGSDYEVLRQNYNTAQESIGQTLIDIYRISESFERGAHQLSEASFDLSQRTENQATTLNSFSTSLSGLADRTKSAAERAKSVEGRVHSSSRNVEQSGEIVTSAMIAMEAIEKSSAEVQKIISVIEDIAFQTNLLALNAAVEAARAGESGKGFAVVATEVRQLAGRSADAAQEIRDLISSSVQQVTDGVRLVRDVESTLTDAVSDVRSITGEINDLVSSFLEQSEIVADLDRGVTELDDSTQRSAAMAEETTAATEALRHEAQELLTDVGRFKLPTEERGIGNAA